MALEFAAGQYHFGVFQIQIKPRILGRVEKWLDRGHDEGGMGGGYYLDLSFSQR